MGQIQGQRQALKILHTLGTASFDIEHQLFFFVLIKLKKITFHMSRGVAEETGAFSF